MKRLLLVILSLAAVASAQDKQNRVGEIEFFGYKGLDVAKVRAALPVRVGDVLPEALDARFALIERVGEAVRRQLGRPPTDFSPICCDAGGDWIIYVGLPGASVKSFPYNPAPKGSARLPTEIVTLYDQTMAAVFASVRKRATEDDSKGYALSSDPTLRAKQLAAREYALRHEELVRRVLLTSSDTKQRIVAAHVLGYAQRSDRQIAALVHATRDPDDNVRNNAIRALDVLINSDPKLAARVPAPGFVEMLNSGIWTDRNKGSRMLELLTARRDPRLLRQLRAEALDSLIEMARWHEPGHAKSARLILGRIAGIEEDRLRSLVDAGQIDAILDALRANATKNPDR